MKKSLLTLAVLAGVLMLGLTFIRPAASAGSLNVSLQTHASGFSSAVGLAHHGTNRLFVVERAGRIKIIQPLGGVIATPFLDIDPRVLSSGSEQGLLGLAFHPNYDENGYFYVYYTRDGTASQDGDLVISRFSVTGNPDVADPNSEQILLVIEHSQFSNHNGGNLEFGPDGYLYIGTGDGGSGGDPDDNGQDLGALLGKMLRIDVDLAGPGDPPDNCDISGANYEIPDDNPFADGPGGDCDEIWAWGLRNPWRFAFDPLNGDLFIGDVGQGSWEEIDYQPAASSGGENYGWRCYEGNHTYNTTGCGPIGNYDFPIAEYSHSLGCSVTGGEIYRGALYPELYGHYVYADYCSGRFWSLFKSGNNWTNTFLGDLGGSFTAFGTRKDGEIYVTNGGTVYHIVEDTLGPTNTPLPTFTHTATPTPSITPTPTITPGGPTLTPTPSPTPTATQVEPGAPFGLNLVEVAAGFVEPSVIGSVGFEPARGEGADLFVAEKRGMIWAFDPGVGTAGGSAGQMVGTAAVGTAGSSRGQQNSHGAVPLLVLDIQDRVDDSGFQEGLLGLAFDPQFDQNGLIYVNYTDNFSNTVVSRFTATSFPVDPNTEQVILTIPQPFNDNNGGGLAFGPDGYLYIAVGDGGGVDDPNQLAQDLDDLHGKVLRIDVHNSGTPDCGAGTYAIPASNPFVGEGGCDEIWHYGFRNIWGLTFDALTGDLYIADVGQDDFEEINRQAAGGPSGQNYGWSCREGFDPGPNPCGGAFTDPLHAYDHNDGRSVTGGYVYRGAQYPAMQGYYIFGDFVLGMLWSLDPGDGSVFLHHEFFGSLSAFGEGSDGLLYAADFGTGTIYRLEGIQISTIYLPLVHRAP